jgi:hypothetical protein
VALRSADLTSPSGIPLRDLPGWDVERGGIVHRDSGEDALRLINEETARRLAEQAPGKRD